MKTLSFSHIKFADLQKVVIIRQIANDDLFAEWFAYHARSIYHRAALAFCHSDQKRQ